MRTRRLVALGGEVPLVVALGAMPPAWSAVREMRVGNFYFDDATVGDGRIDATAGDQVRFTVYDAGPGTPHSVEVDGLNIHSGGLAAGETSPRRR